ncbi:sensor histidine kinase [Ideonella azotifigens]|uniref:histidine kinase n=1 Tax=Ideonella azotifigens TaxID=513160 RepID=A0ABN1K3M7_9BURK|nr:sensor histidine kinase [Ideonella azotifigens]MCD2343963.1 sensor histidine kinase [Ideonella azotifigens]
MGSTGWLDTAGARLSLRSRLLLGILLPALLVIAVNTVMLYRQALRAADIAYDRTLLATAKSIGELLEVNSEQPGTHLKATLLYSALEPFEADNRSRIFYKVTGFQGETVSGFEALPTWHGQLPAKGPYAALVDFYDDRYQGTPVRVAVLLQPVVWPGGQGMAMVQVAETLELRQTLARSLLVDTLWHQGALLLLIAAVVGVAVQRATRPIRALSQALHTRAEGDLTPVDSSGAPKELRPLVDATNHLMGRLRHLLDHQRRFVRDASHQLRTPLAVLRVQVQSARRGDVPAELALKEIEVTVARATQLANQMLALAKVEQMRQGEPAPVEDWAEITRAVALDLSALIVDHGLDFEISTQPAPIRSHAWALRELTRNLLHNAIKYSPPQGRLTVQLVCDGRHAALTVADTGPGLGEAQQARLFQPFATGASSLGADEAPTEHGSGLGLAICDQIAHSLQGQVTLESRNVHGRITGLDAIVRLPLAAV